MKKTTYFKLNKPEYSDPIDIDEITDAFDTIDTALMESRKENELTTNSINEDVLSPYYSIRNTNDFEITVVEREFGTEYTIGAGNQKKVEVYNRGTKMNYYVKDLHEAKFTWFTLGGSGGGSGTSNYNDLSNKPQINGTTLSGNKSLADIGILNSEGKIKSDLLPAFVDNYDSYANRAAFPATGVEDRLYLAQDTRLSYVWDTATSDYVVVGSPLALGEAEGTAYRGDRGKIAYEHSQATHARTDATAVSASTTNGKININGTETTVYAHPTGTSETNPHGTTASDVGLADALKYSEQALSLEQKTQARANIGAGTSSFSGSYSDLSNIPSEFTPASHTHAEYISKNEQTLTSAEKAQARKNIDAVGETTISSVESTVSVNTVPECLGYCGVKMIGGKTEKVTPESGDPYLINGAVEKIVSLGKNLINSQSVHKGYWIDSGNKNENDSNSFYYVVDVNPNSTYTVKFDSNYAESDNVAYVSQMLNDGSVSRITIAGITSYSNLTYTFTTGSNAQKVIVGQYSTTYDDIYNVKYTLAKKDTAISYSPYFKNEISLADITKNLPDYGCSAGSVYNVLDLENMKYYHNVGGKCIKDFSWTPNSIGFESEDVVNLIKLPTNPTRNVFLICAPYDALYSGEPYSEDYNNVIYVVDSNIRITDKSLNSADELISKNGNQKIYYELADDKKKVYDLTSILAPIACEEGGTITLANTHSLDVPNTICYKKEV